MSRQTPNNQYIFRYGRVMFSSDILARTIYNPWKYVFGNQTMEALLYRLLPAMKAWMGLYQTGRVYHNTGARHAEMKEPANLMADVCWLIVCCW